MFPTILKLGPVVISTTGVFTALGFFFGSFLVWKKAKEEYFDEDQLMDGLILTVLAGLVAARAGYTLANWKEQILILDLVGKPGFSWTTGLVVGIFCLAFYCKQRKWDFYKVADLSVFGLTLGLIFNKIGQFLASFNWSFLAEFVLLLLIYRLLCIFDKNYRTYEWYKDKRGEAKPGFLLLAFLILTSLVRLGARILNHKLGFNFLAPGALIFLSLGIFYFRSGGRDLTNCLPWGKKSRGTNK